MRPIIIDGQQHLEVSEFGDFFTSLCRKHSEEQRALAFAFLMYDFRDPQIRKILADDDYWESLHRISGKYITIFYIDTKRKQNQIAWPEMEPGKIYNMYSLFAEPIEPVNTFLRDQFGISEKVKQPLIVFFTADGEDFSANFAIELKQEEVDKAFVELKTAILKAVEAAERIHPENYGNAGPILREIKRNVERDPLLNLVQTHGPKVAKAAVVAAVKTLVEKAILN